MAYAKGVFSSKSFQALVAVAVTGGVGVLVLDSGSLAAFKGDNERIPRRKIKLNTAKVERKRVELRFLDFMIPFNLLLPVIIYFDGSKITLLP